MACHGILSFYISARTIWYWAANPIVCVVARKDYEIRIVSADVIIDVLHNGAQCLMAREAAIRDVQLTYIQDLTQGFK